MVSKKELSSKHIKRIMDNILAPGLTQNQIIDLINFSVITIEKEIKFLLDSSQEISFFKYQNQFIPSLQVFRAQNNLDIPSVSVDEGAVPYVLNGADIFSSGIVNVDKFRENDIVTVKNPQGHVLCVGQALESSESIEEKKGKAIKNIHYLGDKIWENTY